MLCVAANSWIDAMALPLLNFIMNWNTICDPHNGDNWVIIASVLNVPFKEEMISFTLY